MVISVQDNVGIGKPLVENMGLALEAARIENQYEVSIYARAHIKLLGHCRNVLKECLKDTPEDLHGYINGCLVEIENLTGE